MTQPLQVGRDFQNSPSDCGDEYAFGDFSSNLAFIAAAVFGVVGVVLNFIVIILTFIYF